MMRTYIAALALIQTAFSGALAPPAAAQGYKALYSFPGGAGGNQPFSALVNLNGLLYGTTFLGGSGCGSRGCGTIYSVDPNSGAETIVYAFRGGRDGSTPISGLTAVRDRLYGTTTAGGAGAGCQDFSHKGCGTIYWFDPKTGAEHVVHRFSKNGTDGFNPGASPTLVGSVLYGTTRAGGQHDSGTIYALDPASGAYKIAYPFTATDGNILVGGLLYWRGKLYGVNAAGGSTTACDHAGCGNVFSFDIKSGREATVYDFVGGDDGDQPAGDLVPIKGKLYGTTTFGGLGCHIPGCGTLFSIDPTIGAERVVYRFKGFPADGDEPSAGLTLMNGILYGPTEHGGDTDRGTIYSFNLSTGQEAVLHTFAGGAQGSFPLADFLNLNGTLYGTAINTEALHCHAHCGTVFEFVP